MSSSVFEKGREEGGTRWVRNRVQKYGVGHDHREAGRRVDVPVEGDVLSRSLNSFAGRQSLRVMAASWNSGSKFLRIRLYPILFTVQHFS